eukprot:Em0001g3547a
MAADLTMKQVLMELKAAMGKEGRRCRPFHIMLIGASGAGKTSFLNFIGQIGAINSVGFDGMMANFKLYNDAKLERVPDDPWASKTSATMSYDMKIGDVTLKITDTPPLGVDTAGFGKAKENVHNIIEYLKTVDFLDCICLVINGRLPSVMQFALSEISAILPNVATNNTIVCLTNCEKLSKSTLDLNNVNDCFKTKVANRGKIFCFDNPLCILENVRRLSPKEYASEIEDIEDEFTVASKEFTEFLYRLKEFNAIPTSIFMEVYAVKQAIEREILAITVHQYNQDQLEKIGKTDHRMDVTPSATYNVAFHCRMIPQLLRIVLAWQDPIKQESSQALKELSATIEKFNKISSAKNFVQVLKTQLEVVTLYKINSKTPAEELKSAENRLVLAMATIDPSL